MLDSTDQIVAIKLSEVNFVIQACVCFQRLNLGSAESQLLP